MLWMKVGWELASLSPALSLPLHWARHDFLNVATSFYPHFRCSLHAWGGGRGTATTPLALYFRPLRNDKAPEHVYWKERRDDTKIETVTAKLSTKRPLWMGTIGGITFTNFHGILNNLFSGTQETKTLPPLITCLCSRHIVHGCMLVYILRLLKCEHTLLPPPSQPMEARSMNEMYSHAKLYDPWTNHVVAPEFYDETRAELRIGLSVDLALEFLYMFKTVLENMRQSVSWDIRFPGHGDVFPTHEAATHILYLLLLHLPRTSFASPGLGSWGFKLKEKHPTKEMRYPISGCYLA